MGLRQMFAVQTKRTFFTRYLASWGSADTEPIRAASGISAADYTPSNGEGPRDPGCDRVLQRRLVRGAVRALGEWKVRAQETFQAALVVAFDTASMVDQEKQKVLFGPH